MILMSRYKKGQLHGGKRANKFEQGPPPSPSFRTMPERKVFYMRCSLIYHDGGNQQEPLLSKKELEQLRSHKYSCQSLSLVEPHLQVINIIIVIVIIIRN